MCKESSGVWDFDHIDGNGSNNAPSNCQALCPNCHAKKTHGLLKQEKKSSFLLRLIVGIIMFFIILKLVGMLK
jgi:HNH endonuclease